MIGVLSEGKNGESLALKSKRRKHLGSAGTLVETFIELEYSIHVRILENICRQFVMACGRARIHSYK